VTGNHILESAREVNAYYELKIGADKLLGMAKLDEKGSHYVIMSALLMTAFTFEAYLNHLGKAKLAFWSQIEHVGVWQKLNVLALTFEVNLDWSRRPYQTLKSLFDFRNSIAHGKSELIKQSKEVFATGLADIDVFSQGSPKAKWEAFCTLKNAERCLSDMTDLVTKLHNSAQMPGQPFSISGVSLKSLRRKDDYQR
jgi:hypothetical protein